MLPCAQDIFFSSDITNYLNKMNESDLDHQSKDNKRLKMKHSTQIKGKNLIKKHKTEQLVWPAEVEEAFIEALETIPKLGRRKILVNGKPCGRNELISDFIFRKTQKMRSRKQVSSHIQVLKNTRKNDLHFMRLLMDSADRDEEFAAIQQSMNIHQRKSRTASSTSHHSQPAQEPKEIPSGASTASDGLLTPSPSPTDRVLEMMYQDQQTLFSSILNMKDPFINPFVSSVNPPIQNETTSETDILDSSGIRNLFSMQDTSNISTNDVLQQLFPFAASSVDSEPNLTGLAVQQESIGSFLKDEKLKPGKPITLADQKHSRKRRRNTLKSSVSQPDYSLLLQSAIYPLNTSSFPTTSLTMNALDQAASGPTWIDSSIYPLWPNYICLYLEYMPSNESSSTISHTLANTAECVPSAMPCVNATCVARKKCPPILELIPNPALITLAAKIDLNLNINTLDFSFNNTNFFETRDRRTIECTTIVYSFGNIIIESKEVQQALWINEGKYIYSFDYVSQFFDAFIKSVRSLESLKEVDSAIDNLCIVQIFEDVESKISLKKRKKFLFQEELGVDAKIRPNDLKIADITNTNNTAKQKGVILPNTDSPLLTMVYEFGRGQGEFNISLVDNTLLETNPDPLVKTESSDA